jgi:Tol biopolymer transport system component
LKKYQVALLALLAVAAATTVGCGSSSSVPTFTKTSMLSDRTVTPATPLFTMNLDGSSVTPVQTGSSNSIWGLSVRADFKAIVYTSNGEVWAVSPSSGTPTQLTQNAANNSSSNTARISPNGQKIVYPVFNSTNGSIWIMNADGTGSTNLTPTLPTGMVVCYVASFSADSSKITFACWSTNQATFGLFTIRTDGTQLTTVLTQSSPIDTPAFTPDGKQILYVTYGTPGAALKHGFDHMGFGQHLQRSQPDLAPQQLANTGVASVNIDGSNPTLIVPATTNRIGESEILNSNLYYGMSSGNFLQIFKANLDGSGSVSVSDGTADDQLGVCFGCNKVVR